jgi:hypothetical protein
VLHREVFHAVPDTCLSTVSVNRGARQAKMPQIKPFSKLNYLHFKETVWEVSPRMRVPESLLATFCDMKSEPGIGQAA